MITRQAIIEWQENAPWIDMHQVEQDLIISRTLTEIYADDFLASKLAFRGGTALHRLYLSPPARYSEDIDLVQTMQEPIGPVLDRLREVLSFLGEPKIKPKKSNNTMIFSVESTYPHYAPYFNGAKGAISLICFSQLSTPKLKLQLSLIATMSI